MSQSAHDGRSNLWQFVSRQSLPLERESSLYILVSALDVFMTYLLLVYDDVFIESNPLAGYFYAGWDIAGMALYKFGSVAIVCVFSQIIASRELSTARALLNFAAVITSGVVIYSLWLLLSNAPQF